MPVDKSVMVSFRTSQRTKKLLEQVAVEFGGSQTAALEFCLHQYAKRQKIRLPSGASLTGETTEVYNAKDKG